MPLFISSSLTSVEKTYFHLYSIINFQTFFPLFLGKSIVNVSAEKVDILVTENNERKLQQESEIRSHSSICSKHPEYLFIDMFKSNYSAMAKQLHTRDFLFTIAVE